MKHINLVIFLTLFSIDLFCQGIVDAYSEEGLILKDKLEQSLDPEVLKEINAEFHSLESDRSFNSQDKPFKTTKPKVQLSEDIPLAAGKITKTFSENALAKACEVLHLDGTVVGNVLTEVIPKHVKLQIYENIRDSSFTTGTSLVLTKARIENNKVAPTIDELGSAYFSLPSSNSHGAKYNLKSGKLNFGLGDFDYSVNNFSGTELNEGITSLSLSNNFKAGKLPEGKYELSILAPKLTTLDLFKSDDAIETVGKTLGDSQLGLSYDAELSGKNKLKFNIQGNPTNIDHHKVEIDFVHTTDPVNFLGKKNHTIRPEVAVRLATEDGNAFCIGSVGVAGVVDGLNGSRNTLIYKGKMSVNDGDFNAEMSAGLSNPSKTKELALGIYHVEGAGLRDQKGSKSETIIGPSAEIQFKKFGELNPLRLFKRKK